MQNDSIDHHEENFGNPDAVILEEDVDPDYEPTEEEIIEYAQFLGMDPEEDKDFFYIAREGLKAPLPEPWKPCKTHDGELYYFNFETGESQWDHPLDEVYKKKFQDTKALFHKNLERREEQKFQKQLQKQQKMLHTNAVQPPILQKNPSNSNIIVENNNLSGLSYSHHTHSHSHDSKFVSDRKARHEREFSGNLEFVNESPIMEDLKKEEIESKEENDSICFSPDLKIEDENIEDENKEWDHEERARIFEDIENEYKGDIMRYEEELAMKFDEVLAECEIAYQEEAAKIAKEYEEELERAQMEDLPPPDENEEIDLEERKKELEDQIMQENEEELAVQLEQLEAEYEANLRDLEENDDIEFQETLLALEDEYAKDLERRKKDMNQKIEELVEVKNKRLRQDDDMLQEKVRIEKENYERKKRDAMAEYSKKLIEVDVEESTRMNKELENFRKELEAKLEREKMIYVQSSRRNYTDEFELRKIELQQVYNDKLEQEKARLLEEAEKAIKEIQENERKKLEESAERNVEALLRPDFDKKYNSLEVEKLLYEQQWRKRLDEVRAQLDKQMEIERAVSIAAEKEFTEMIEAINNEIKNINNQITDCESIFTQMQKAQKEMENIQKETKEKEKKIAKMEEEIAPLNQNYEELKAQIEEYNAKFAGLRQAMTNKTHLISKVDELYRQVELKDREIETLRERNLANERNSLRTLNESIDVSKQTSMTHLNKILREVEEIKAFIAIKKSAPKKSSSVGRLVPNRSGSIKILQNMTIDHGRMNSYMEGDESDEENYVDKTILEPDMKHNRSRFYEQSVENRIEEESERSTYRNNAPTFGGVEHRSKPKPIDWKRFVLSEKAKLEKIYEMLHHKKNQIREMQDDLKREQAQYKQEYSHFKSLPNPSNTL